MSRKTEFERECERPIRDNHCETERGEGRRASSGDGRTTKEDNPFFSDD